MRSLDLGLVVLFSRVGELSRKQGLRVLDIQDGTGQSPEAGDECIVQWNGYTSGYQGKRFGELGFRVLFESMKQA